MWITCSQKEKKQKKPIRSRLEEIKEKKEKVPLRKITILNWYPKGTILFISCDIQLLITEIPVQVYEVSLSTVCLSAKILTRGFLYLRLYDSYYVSI